MFNIFIIVRAFMNGGVSGAINELVSQLSPATINVVFNMLSPQSEQALFNVLTPESVAKIAASLHPSVAAGVPSLPPVFQAFFNPTYTDTAANDTFVDARGTFRASDINGDVLIYGLAGATATSTVLDGVSYNRVAASTYGELYLNISTGAYRFVANDAAIEALTAAASANFAITVRDGAHLVTKAFSIALNGANDATIVRGPVTGTATEDGAAVTLNALANASDRDSGQTLSVVDLPASLPAGVSYNAATYSFTLDPSHADYQDLAAGAPATVTVNYGVSDGVATTAASVSWTVTGSNDAATITFNGLQDTTVTEAGGIANGTAGDPSAAGDLDVSDVDFGQAKFQAPTAASLAGVYGNFTFNEDTGAWTYTLDNADNDTQLLSAGAPASDSLTVMSFDGTDSETITIDITGSNDTVPTLSLESTRGEGNQDWFGALGMDFDVHSPISILTLGAFDSGQDGFVNPLTVGIFDRNTGLLIESSATITSSETLIGQSRFFDVTDLCLRPGTIRSSRRVFHWTI
jgi:VCBS repeat-containing protein